MSTIDYFTETNKRSECHLKQEFILDFYGPKSNWCEAFNTSLWQKLKKNSRQSLEMKLEDGWTGRYCFHIMHLFYVLSVKKKTPWP
jgi:hypothetical protein